MSVELEHTLLKVDPTVKSSLLLCLQSPQARSSPLINRALPTGLTQPPGPHCPAITQYISTLPLFNLTLLLTWNAWYVQRHTLPFRWSHTHTHTNTQFNTHMHTFTFTLTHTHKLALRLLFLQEMGRRLAFSQLAGRQADMVR